MDETLTLNDGTIIMESHILVVNQDVFLYINNGMRLAEAFELLNDPEKTKVIIADQYGEKTVYRGYNHLYAIKEEIDTLLTACIKKG